MKQNTFKKLIKEAVKEAFQEELKEVLLEAVRSPKQTIIENTQPTQTVIDGPSMGSKERRESYQNILGDMKSSFNTSHSGGPLQLKGSMDTVSEGASLPEGNVSIDQIANLMRR
jgi:hypothetical protein